MQLKIASAPQAYSSLFEKFWEKYPRKVNKYSAVKVFNKINPDEILLQHMIKSLQEQKQYWEEWKYIPHASTWLNQRRWEDETEKSTLDTWASA